MRAQASRIIPRSSTGKWAVEDKPENGSGVIVLCVRGARRGARGGALRDGVSHNRAASAVGVFVALEEFQQDDLLALVVDVVQDPVRTDPPSVLRGEL